MKSFKGLVSAALACVALAMSSGAAVASPVSYDYAYHGLGFAGSGILVVDNGLITDIDGERNGVAISGLVPLGADPGFIYNQLFDKNNLVPFDLSGLLYELVDGRRFNLYGDGGVKEAYYDPSGAPQINDALFIFARTDGTPVNGVPEPASLVLTASALSGLAFVRRRKAAPAPRGAQAVA